MHKKRKKHEDSLCVYDSCYHCRVFLPNLRNGMVHLPDLIWIDSVFGIDQYSSGISRGSGDRRAETAGKSRKRYYTGNRNWLESNC